MIIPRSFSDPNYTNIYHHWSFFDNIRILLRNNQKHTRLDYFFKSFIRKSHESNWILPVTLNPWFYFSSVHKSLNNICGLIETSSIQEADLLFLFCLFGWSQIYAKRGDGILVCGGCRFKRKGRRVLLKF